MNPIIPSTAAPIPKPQELNAVPDVIKLEILKGLSVKNLCAASCLNKSWHKVNNSKPLWTQLANKLGIRINNPENVKAELIEYWKALPAVNKKLQGYNIPVQVKEDAFEQIQEWQSVVKEKLSNPEIAQES